MARKLVFVGIILAIVVLLLAWLRPDPAPFIEDDIVTPIEEGLIDPAIKGLGGTQAGADPSENVADRSWMWRLWVSINDWRNNHGLASVELNEIITLHTDKHSHAMAQRGDIYHSDYGIMPGFRRQGETVGVGSDPYKVQHAFIDSPKHKSIILGSGWTSVGVAAVFSDNSWWITYIFAS